MHKHADPRQGTAACTRVCVHTLRRGTAAHAHGRAAQHGCTRTHTHTHAYPRRHGTATPAHTAPAHAHAHRTLHTATHTYRDRPAQRWYAQTHARTNAHTNTHAHTPTPVPAGPPLPGPTLPAVPASPRSTGQERSCPFPCRGGISLTAAPGGGGGWGAVRRLRVPVCLSRGGGTLRSGPQYRGRAGLSPGGLPAVLAHCPAGAGTSPPGGPAPHARHGCGFRTRREPPALGLPRQRGSPGPRGAQPAPASAPPAPAPARSGGGEEMPGAGGGRRQQVN